MKTVTIKHLKTGQSLYEGRFTNIRQAAEAAVSEGVSLAFADLRYANLMNAQLDGAILDDAWLDEANLIGANLSEASLRRTSLQNVQLHNAVLCEAMLDSVNGKGALFGGTDICGSQIIRCEFDTLSALDLDFRDASHIQMNSFASINEHICEFSRPPVVIKGLPFQIACFDRHLMIEHHALPVFHEISPAGMSSVFLSFIACHKDLFDRLWQDCDAHLTPA